MNHKILKIHPKDNVLVALSDLKQGEVIEFEGKKWTILQDVPAKHKFTTESISTGNHIYMYGVIVGKAKINLSQGQVITTQNVAHEANSFGEKTEITSWMAPRVEKFINKTFKGFHRADGQVGTANYWLIIPLVFCENRNVEVIKDAFLEELGFAKQNPFKSLVQQMKALYQSGNVQKIETLVAEKSIVDGIHPLFENINGLKFLTHQGGCGGTRQDSEMLCTLLAGYIHNPNVAGATVLSLGCQNAQPAILRDKLEQLQTNFQKPVYILEQQVEGTENQLISEAIKKTFLGLIEANKYERQEAPLSKLSIGLECGGSDGFSGISANPTVGHVSDLIVALGGKTILSEFPELCGVEQELINRCVDNSIAEKFSHLMSAYASAAVKAGSGFDMNPSPGNIKDGLITDAIKSAGAAKKGGTSPVVDVLDYGEYLQKNGLNLLCTPGNDVESTTAMAGSGANIILFTTGLGTPTGNPIVPVIKISSNTRLAERMPDIIDFNTGPIISGEKTIETMGEELLDHIISVASGELQTKAQQLGQDDFIPWKRGVSL